LRWKMLKVLQGAKDLVGELALPHAQSAWGSRREMVRAAG